MSSTHLTGVVKSGRTEWVILLFTSTTLVVIPALIRKMHIAKCLENKDIDSIRKDLNKRPIENINSKSSNEAILNILAKYGISLIQHLTFNIQHSSNVSLKLWGRGSPRREFLYVDDLADAVLFLMNNYSPRRTKDIGEFVNIGTGKDITIKELAELIKEIVGFKGKIEWDASKPDGTPQKLLDISLLNQNGWRSKTTLKKGIRKNYIRYTK